MARPPLLPTDLTPSQVVALQDALLANADRLLRAAFAMLDADDVPLARSLAILGMEESGKAIALHERRLQMAYVPDGEAFVDQCLLDLWGLHGKKLEVVYDFLVREDYWFGTGPSDPDETARALGTIEEWKRDHNLIKHRGFYVDVTPDGEPVVPQEIADGDAGREVLQHVHQIGWQLRLGEHIEGKRQLESQQAVPPATEEEIEAMRSLMRRVQDAEMVEHILDTMRAGKSAQALNNAGYAFVLPENPFDTVGRPGYEAQDRELAALAREVYGNAGEEHTAED